MIYRVKNKAPSQRLICLPLPVKTKINSRTETPILTHKSVTLSVVTFRGDMPAEAPQDQEGIEDIRTHDISDGYICVFLAGSDQGSG